MDYRTLLQFQTIKTLFDIEDENNIKPGTKAFLDAMVEKTYKDNEDIVHIGNDASDGMYVLIKGGANVYDAEDDLINQLHEGDVIGELALINDEARAATVRANGDVTVANITRDLFEEITIANRKILGSFLSMLYNKTTRLVEEREQIIYVSEHDQLTGLYNKGKYLSVVKDLVPTLDSIGLFNMDVNNLKKLNDTEGHEKGDKLLQKAANSMKAVTNNKVLGFRMGGDEFLMIACNVTETEVNNIRQNWESELNRLNKLNDGIDCIIAVGVVYAEKPFDFAAISKQADDLMYEDKKAKKKPGEEIR